MSTSLSEQLNRLAVPQTSLLKQDKKKASLLFDRKQAAEISRETYYQIGLDGFEDLKLKCALFTPFENTLFHSTAKEFERSVQDAAANEKLDKQIRKFFLLLSPYLSLTCAHKALEWLISRYHIQEYNRNDFLMLILPYHETNIFVRALQLIKIKEAGDSFVWLKGTQRGNVQLSKDILYKHTAKNPRLLKEIGEFILQAFDECDQPYTVRILINFYCRTATGALEYSDDISEAYITQILSTLLKGMKSPIADFCASSYIITAKLLSKIKLSEKILHKFVDNISLVPVDHLKMEAILLLTILYQTQQHFTEMSEFATRNFVRKVWITEILKQLSTTANFVDSVVVTLFKKCVEGGFREDGWNECRTCALALLNDVQMEVSSISHFINIVLEAYKANRKNLSNDARDWISTIMSIFETRYPDVFDKEIKTIMKAEYGEKLSKTQKCLQNLIINSQGSNTSTFNKLFHPVRDVRKSSIKHYIKIYDDLDKKEQEVLNKIFLDKLRDEDPEVVLKLLCQSTKLLPKVIDKIVLRDALIKLLFKTSDYKWRKVSYPILNILCTIADDDDVITLVAVLPFILPVKESDIKIATLVAHSRYFANCPYLKSIDIETLKKASTPDTFFNIVYNQLESIRLNIDKYEDVLSYYLDQEQSFVLKYVFLTLICTLLPENGPDSVSSLLLDALRTYISKSKSDLTESECVMRNCLLLAKQNQISVRGILYCIEILVRRTAVPKLESYGSLCSSKGRIFVVDLLEVLLAACYSKKSDASALYANLFKEFLEKIFLDFQARIEFLLNVCVINLKEIGTDLQLRSLRTANALIAVTNKVGVNEKIAATNKWGLNEKVAAYLLIGMTNKSKEIRFWVINTITSILENTNVSPGRNYTLLFQNILNYTEEIVVDEKQISNILNELTGIKSGYKEMRSVCSDLLGLVKNGSLPLYFRLALVNVFIACTHFEIYNILTEFAVEMLQVNKDMKGTLDKTTSTILYDIFLGLDGANAMRIVESSNGYRMIALALRCDGFELSYSDVGVTPSALCMACVQDVFEHFQDEVKVRLLDDILAAVACTVNPDVVTAARKIFKHVDLDADLILQRLVDMYDVFQPKFARIKRRRASSIPTTDILECSEWKKGIATLEFLQDKKKIRRSEILIPLLFKILKKCLDFDEQSNVEYPKQILLSTLLNCCKKAEDADISENTFSVEILVQCIRASQNPQTHHHALLVLAHSATFVPKQVLHNIMAIFTFMGSSVLRYDDAYTFQIINKIIDSIIPILVEDRSLPDIVNVLRVFVDAVLDVPEHRRATLYHNLLEKLGAKRNLYLFILLMLEACVLHANTEKQRTKGAAAPSAPPSKSAVAAPQRLDIIVDICRRFPSEIVIESCIKIVTYLQKLPEEKEQVADVDLPFEIGHQTTKQYRHYKYVTIMFIAQLLSSPQFITNIAGLSDKTLEKLEGVYKNMIITTVTYIQYVAKTVDKNRNTSQARYWKTILHHSCDVLDSINRLLTPSMFLLVIRGLTTHSLNHIRRRSLELLNNKLQGEFEFFANCSESEIYAVIPALLNTIKQSESDENFVTIQTAFLSLKLFIKHFAKDDLGKFVETLDYLTVFIKGGRTQPNVLASAVLCLAELCTHLRAHAVSNLNKFMPSLLKMLKTNRDHPDLLQLSVVTALLKILESLPLFLSSYLEKILYELSFMLSRWGDSKEAKLQPIIGKLRCIKEKIAVLIPFRTLIPAITRTYQQIIEDRDYPSVCALTGVLSQKLSQASTSEIQTNLSELTAFFLNMLRFRSDRLASFEETNKIEKSIVDSATTFCLKLSESAFRPLYYKMYDWAVRHETNKSERLITFYAFSSEIAQHLKSLFVLFAAHILNNATNLLDLCNSTKHPEPYYGDEEKSALLLRFILQTLHAVFFYDARKFVNKDRFELLVQPLVDQLENRLGNDYLPRNETLVIPCIVKFAYATADDNCWKRLNYEILLKMRHSSASVRILSLKCVLEFATKLGADFLPLLPETIPFLAELLEDDDEDVEKICRKTVQQLEKILGEPLQKYF